jgi:hypothetical protein
MSFTPQMDAIMTRGLGLVMAAALAAWTFAGCSGGAPPAEGEKKEEEGKISAVGQGPMLEVTPESTPDDVVTAFVEALRSGDDQGIAQLLTDKAREETAKHGMTVAPTAMPGAKYQVGQPKYIKNNPNGAHVSCMLTESFENGETAQYEIVWVLRREAELGWRIAGMAVELVPGQAPQFLNFEDPLDMQKKKEEAMALLQQQEEEAAAQEAKAQNVEPLPKR